MDGKVKRRDGTCTHERERENGDKQELINWFKSDGIKKKREE